MLTLHTKKILITGANGFVGRHLASYLAHTAGCTHIYGIDKQLGLSNSQNPHCSFSYIDIENYSEVNNMIRSIEPDIVFHLAANIKPSRDLCDLDEMIKTNILGTTNILSTIVNNTIQLDCFINLGTSEEYGNGRPPFDEAHSPSPVSLYSGTKSAMTMLCKMFYNTFGIPVITARPSLVYGPGQGTRFFIIQAIHKLLANEDFDMTPGEQTRDFIFIDDLVKGLVAISTTPDLAGEIVNISSGVEQKLRDIVLTIAKLTGSKSKINIGALPYRDSEIMRFVSSNQKITSFTGWKPEISLEEGLIMTIEYMKGVAPG